MRKKKKEVLWHTLFADRNKSEVRIAFTSSTIERFIELWNTGAGVNEICFDLKLKQVEFALIAMSLHYSDIISERATGIMKG